MSRVSSRSGTQDTVLIDKRCFPSSPNSGTRENELNGDHPRLAFVASLAVQTNQFQERVLAVYEEAIAMDLKSFKEEFLRTQASKASEEIPAQSVAPRQAVELQRGDTCESPYPPPSLISASGWTEKRQMSKGGSEEFPSQSVSRQSIRKTELSNLLKGTIKTDENGFKACATTSDLSQSGKSRYCNLKRFESVVDSVMGVLITSNLVQMGVSSDFNRGSLMWIIADVFFASSFLIELIIKVSLHGIRGYFFTRGHRFWAWVDTVIVAFAMLETVLAVGSINFHGSFYFSLIRMVRLCRLGRIIRLMRMPIFKDLVMMVDGIIGGSRTLFWSVVLLLCPLYPFALILRETLGESEKVTLQSENFRSMPTAMFTVLRCVLGDCSDENGQPIFVHVSNDFGWMYGMGYSFILILFTFGLFNVIAAIYVENTVVAAKSNDTLQRHRRLSDETRKAQLSSRLLRMCLKVMFDTDDNGNFKTKIDTISDEDLADFEISKDMFSILKDHHEFNQLLDQLDVSHDDRIGLFDILDADGSGTLQLDEFLQGIMSLRGEARRSDIIGTSLQVRALQEKVDDIDIRLKDQLRTVEDLVTGATSAVLLNHTMMKNLDERVALVQRACDPVETI